jgi:DNA repair exonuclease SbcCD nuclease subunit
MKVSIIADPHLNKSVYKSVSDKEVSDLPFRTVDFMKAYENAVDKVIKIKPDLNVVVGDVFDTFDPSNSVRRFLNEQIMKLSNSDIPTVYITGNHDVCRKHHPLEPILPFKIKGVKILDEPMVIQFKDKILMFFPYSIKVEKGDIDIKDQFNSFISKTKEIISKTGDMQNKDILFFGHFPVKGGGLNSYSVEDGESIIIKKTIFNKSTKDISLLDLDSIGASYVFLGDFHKHQVLDTKKCKAMYIGSLEKTDVSEVEEKKGFILYDSEMKEDPILGKCSFIENESCRPIVILSGTIENMENQLKKIDKSDNAIVKIAFSGNSNELTSFSANIESLKRKLKDKIDPIHIIHTQDVKDEEESKKALDIEKNIIERGHIEIEDVLDVVNEMIKEKISDNEEVLLLEKMAAEIYKDVREGN